MPGRAAEERFYSLAGGCQGGSSACPAVNVL